jgi:hypothetical protein
LEGEIRETNERGDSCDKFESSVEWSWQASRAVNMRSSSIERIFAETPLGDCALLNRMIGLESKSDHGFIPKANGKLRPLGI